MSATCRILFRVDGDEKTGAGHVMRMLALAEAMRAADPTVHVEFVCVRLARVLEQKLLAAGFCINRLAAEAGSPHDCRLLLARAREVDATWIVLDGYDFPAAYRDEVFLSGSQVLAIDDLGLVPIDTVDLLLKPIAAPQRDAAAPGLAGEQLLGPRYALVARRFAERRGCDRSALGPATRLLVSCGAADPANLSSMALRAIAALTGSQRPLETVLVVGPANSRLAELTEEMHSLGLAGQVIVDPPDLPERMAWADVAVAAAGSTCWELAALGLPALVAIVADNQVELAEMFAQQGVVVNLGWAHRLDHLRLAEELADLLDDASRRRAMSQAGRRLVDARGAARVARTMFGTTLQLRPVVMDDAELLFQWANEPVTRAMSFSNAAISWAEHRAWLADRLAAGQRWAAWIASDARGEPVGLVRYDVAQDEAIVAISIAPALRGRGFGRRLLQRSARRLFHTHEVCRIHALVRPENEASRRALLAAGYGEWNHTTFRDRPACHFALDRCEVLAAAAKRDFSSGFQLLMATTGPGQ